MTNNQRAAVGAAFIALFAWDNTGVSDRAAVAEVGGVKCYYTTSDTCGTGYHRQPGKYNNGTAGAHNICCSGAGVVETQTGYFVGTESLWTGDLGGLSGANAKCLAELQSQIWLGKDSAVLNSSTVKAFLCDATECQDPMPNTRYIFARAAYPNSGGESFTTDLYGRGPLENYAWNTVDRMGPGTLNYWSGERDTVLDHLWGVRVPWPGNDRHCTSWTSTASTGRRGSTSSVNSPRWHNDAVVCSTGRPLVCMVHPVSN